MSAGVIAASNVLTADYAAAVLADAPLMWWRMDDNGQVLDYSGNNRHADTRTNPLTYLTNGLIAGASKSVAFGGGGSRVSIASATWMNVNFFTVEAWVQNIAWAPAGGGNWVIGRDLAGANNDLDWHLMMDAAGARVAMLTAEAPTTPRTLVCPILPLPYSTYHLVATFDGTNLRMYVNGVEATGSPLAVSGTTKKNSTIIIAGGFGGGFGNTADFRGWMDEVAFYGSALSAARVLAHYNAGAIPWKYWPDTGSRAVPWVASSTVTSGLPAIPTGSSGTAAATTSPGGAIAQIQAVPPPFTTNAAQTVELWFTKPAAAVKGALWKVGSGDSVGGWLIGLGATDMDTNGNNLLLAREALAWHTISAVSTGKHHLVVTRSGANFEIYLDAVSVYGPASPGTINAITTGMAFGGYTVGLITRSLSSTVSIDKPALYDTVLSAARVTAHYNGGAGSDAAVAADTPVVLLELDGAPA